MKNVIHCLCVEIFRVSVFISYGFDFSSYLKISVLLYVGLFIAAEREFAGDEISLEVLAITFILSHMHFPRPSRDDCQQTQHHLTENFFDHNGVSQEINTKNVILHSLFLHFAKFKISTCIICKSVIKTQYTVLVCKKYVCL